MLYICAWCETGTIMCCCVVFRNSFYLCTHFRLVQYWLCKGLSLKVVVSSLFTKSVYFEWWKVLKPTSLDLDANALDFPKQWKHWRKTFENFLDECFENVPQGGSQPNNLYTLTNYVSHSVIKHIDETDDYGQCIAKLKGLYCKPPNEIFAHHCLATHCQEPGESTEKFLVALKKLSKDCNFQTVTGEVY